MFWETLGQAWVKTDWYIHALCLMSNHFHLVVETPRANLKSEEVQPELDDDPDAGVPELAKQNGLRRVLCVADVQDIVLNAKEQKPDATIAELFSAFEFYYKRDAFIKFN